MGCSSKHIEITTQIPTSHKKVSDSLYYLAKEDVASRYPQSGFYPLENNLDAYMAKIALIESAKKTLQLQYFIFSNDEISQGLTQYIVEAADRGVKVRIIVDDLMEKFKDDMMISIGQHPNIEIKLFNPSAYRRLYGWLEIGLNLDTLGRRMHNKVLVADDSACIIGGRNIQNIYFAADRNDIFIDNEVLAIGPLALEAANEFEIYWNSPVVKTAKEVNPHAKVIPMRKLRKELFKNKEKLRNNHYIQEMMERKFAQAYKKHEIPLFFGKAELYYDMPTKVITNEEDSSTHLSEHLIPYFLNAKHSIKIINPYFIPNEKMMRSIKKLREKGVEIYILTNSLATNDAIPVYSAYSKYQRALVELGVHLYELNPDSFSYIYKKQRYRKGKIPRSSLHAKSMVIDDTFIIGSVNLDPRSKKLNTEVVAVIHSKALSKYESEVFDAAVAPQNVFRIELEKAPKQKCIATCIAQKDKRIVWITQRNGKEVRYYNDANAGFWRRLGSNLSFYIPLNKYL